MKIKILGKEWKIKLISAKTYEKNHGKDSDAIADLVKRIIYFRKDEFDLEVIRHEIFHGYIKESMISRTCPDVDQMEELGAEIVGRHAEEIVALAKEIYSHYSS